jgi:hypothetical protein
MKYVIPKLFTCGVRTVGLYWGNLHSEAVGILQGAKKFVGIYWRLHLTAYISGACGCTDTM